MSTTLEVIRKAEARGIVFQLVDSELDVSFPEGTKTPKVVDWIRDNKEEILLYLEEPYRDGLGTPFLIINSRLLGDEIVIAQDDATLPTEATQGRVVYRESELRRLLADKHSEAHLKHIHAVKKEIGGTIETPEEGEI